MNVPFLHKTTLAFYPVAQGVEWASLTTMLHREQQFESGFIEGIAPLVWKEVASLIKEKNWAHAGIVVRLNPMYVRHFLIQGPVVETAEEFDRWMADEVALKLPAGANQDDFVFRCRVLHQDEDHIECLVGLARRNSIQEQLDELHAAGIFPTVLSGLFAEFDQLSQEQVADSRYGYSVFLNDQETICLGYHQGILTSVQSFAGLEDQPVAWRKSLVAAITELHPSPEAGQLGICGMEEAFEQLPREELKLMGVSVGRWNGMQAARGVEEDRFASSILARSNSTNLPDFNFLDEEQVYEQVRAGEKSQAMKVILGGGCVLAGLLAILLVLEMLVASRLVDTEEDLMLMGSQIAVLDQQQSAIKDLEAQLQEARRFIGERTESAEVLSRIGRCIPEKVWLNQLNVVRGDGGHWEISIEGAALNEEDVAGLLGRLEQIDRVQEVELMLSEMVVASRLYRKDKLRDIEVTRFEIVVRLPASVNSQKDQEVS